MTAVFRKAERRKARARIGLTGPAGAGKTYTALQLAFGLAEPGGKVAVIDTENGSADLYAHLGAYDVLTLEAPFRVEKYLAGIQAAEEAGYEVLIVDSLSHAWAGEGGLLDQKDSIPGNSFAAWRHISPLHNKLVEAMLQTSCNVIATMRSKTEYTLEETEKGKVVPKKIGLAPIQREGMDYEFTLVFDIDQSKHVAHASKDRTSLFDGTYETLTAEHGRRIRRWLDGELAPAAPTPRPAARGEAAVEQAARTTRAKAEELTLSTEDLDRYAVGRLGAGLSALSLDSWRSLYRDLSSGAVVTWLMEQDAPKSPAAGEPPTPPVLTPPTPPPPQEVAPSPSPPVEAQSRQVVRLRRRREPVDPRYFAAKNEVLTAGVRGPTLNDIYRRLEFTPGARPLVEAFLRELELSNPNPTFLREEEGEALVRRLEEAFPLAPPSPPRTLHTVPFEQASPQIPAEDGLIECPGDQGDRMSPLYCSETCQDRDTCGSFEAYNSPGRPQIRGNPVQPRGNDGGRANLF